DRRDRSRAHPGSEKTDRDIHAGAFRLSRVGNPVARLRDAAQPFHSSNDRKTVPEKGSQTMKYRMNVLTALIASTVAAAATTEANAFSPKGGNGSHGGNAVVCFSDPSIVSGVLRNPEAARTIPSSALSKITLVRL